MKVKVMISQPMRERTDEEIKKERNYIISRAVSQDMEVLDTLFDFDGKNPVYYLAKSIEVMSEADVVIFAKGWEQSRGCRIEFEIAKNYGKQILILGDTY